MQINYAVGQVLPEYINKPDGVIFEMTDAGAIAIFYMNRPTEQEMEQIQTVKSFDIRFKEIDNVIMVTMKLGSLPWMDAPFTPHLSRHHLSIQDMPDCVETEGLSLTMVFVDTSTGKIVYLRVIGLGNKFSNNLIALAKKVDKTEFDRVEYNKKLQQIFTRYTTKQIASMSKDYYKIR